MFRRPLRRTVPVAIFVLLCLLLYLQNAGRPFFSAAQYRKLPYKYVSSDYDWAGFSFTHPWGPSDLVQLPAGESKPLRQIQFAFQSGTPAASGSAKLKQRRDAVRAAFVKSWTSYKEHAWMWDELAPLSGSRKNTFGGLGATLVDALDTLWIMGLKDDFGEAVRAVAALDYTKTSDTSLNLFETTIRHLGGLLSAYDLSADPVLLRKATDLGDMLYVAFDTPNHLPSFWFSFADAKAGTQEAGTGDPAASPTSLALEFTRLSQLTGDPKYYSAISPVTALLEKTQQKSRLPGMWPRLINFRQETVPDNDFSLGALADSLYEYLPKMFALLGGREPRYEALYRTAMATVEDNLLFRPMTPDNADILFAGTVSVGNDAIARLDPESEHLACFAGGMFGLGGRLFGIDDHVELGDKLARGCAWGYAQFKTGILPEIFGLAPCESPDDGCTWNESRWDAIADLPKGFTHARDARYILRPEAIESVFLLYRITGQPDLQDIAWDMFQAITKATETQFAFAAIANVNTDEPNKVDSMEVCMKGGRYLVGFMANSFHTELLAFRDAQVLLPDLLAARPH